MSMRRRWFVAAVVVGILVLTACVTTSAPRTIVTGAWKDDHYNNKLSTFLIISLSDNHAIRTEFENALAVSLGMKGLRAEASSDLMPMEQKINRETVKAVMAGKGFDAVLVSRLIGVAREARYVSPSANATFDSSFSSGPTIISSPGYVEHKVVVSLQIDLYETEKEHLVWSLKTQSFNPSNATEVIDKLSEDIVSDLAAKGLI